MALVTQIPYCHDLHLPIGVRLVPFAFLDHLRLRIARLFPLLPALPVGVFVHIGHRMPMDGVYAHDTIHHLDLAQLDTSGSALPQNLITDRCQFLPSAGLPQTPVELAPGAMIGGRFVHGQTYELLPLRQGYMIARLKLVASST
jgi:hypothetical protein